MAVQPPSFAQKSKQWTGWREPITWEDNDWYRRDQISEIDANMNLARYYSARGEFGETLKLADEAIVQLATIESKHSAGERKISALLIKSEALNRLNEKAKAKSCFLSALKLMRKKLSGTGDPFRLAYDEALAANLGRHLSQSNRICEGALEHLGLPIASRSDWRARFLLLEALNLAYSGNVPEAKSMLSQANDVLKSFKAAKKKTPAEKPQTTQKDSKPLALDQVAINERNRMKLPSAQGFAVFVEGVIARVDGRLSDAAILLGDSIGKMQEAGGSDFYALQALLELCRCHLTENTKEAVDAFRRASYHLGKDEAEKRLVDETSSLLHSTLQSRAIQLLKSDKLIVPVELPTLVRMRASSRLQESVSELTSFCSPIQPEMSSETRSSLAQVAQLLTALAKINRSRNRLDNSIEQDLDAIALFWACGAKNDMIAECWYGIGEAYGEKKKWQLAIRPLQRALALSIMKAPFSDNSFSTALLLAKAYKETKKFQDAEMVSKFAIARACAKAGGFARKIPTDIADKETDEFLKNSVDLLKPAELSGQKRIAELLEQYADILGDEKRPADAIKVINRVIAVKRIDPDKRAGLWNDIWGLAWQLQAMRDFDGARDQYTHMIENYTDVIAKIKADWYYYRALVQDLNGKSKPAEADYKKAAKYYRTALKEGSDDKGWLDWIAYMEFDMKEQLQMKRTCPSTRMDYVDALPTFYWAKERMPVKVFIDTSRESGYGPRFNACFKKAFEVWATIPESYLRCVFIDDPEDADIVVKRVVEYREIPQGSGGRTISFYKFKGQRRTKIIDQVRIIMFCKSYNGEGMTEYDRKDLCGLCMHEAGHAFGLQHSPHGPDVMYWKSMAPDLTEKDKESIRILYPLDTQKKRKAQKTHRK